MKFTIEFPGHSEKEKEISDEVARHIERLSEITGGNWEYISELYNNIMSVIESGYYDEIVVGIVRGAVLSSKYLVFDDGSLIPHGGYEFDGVDEEDDDEQGELEGGFLDKNSDNDYFEETADNIHYEYEECDDDIWSPAELAKMEFVKSKEYRKVKLILDKLITYKMWDGYYSDNVRSVLDIFNDWMDVFEEMNDRFELIAEEHSIKKFDSEGDWIVNTEISEALEDVENDNVLFLYDNPLLRYWKNFVEYSLRMMVNLQKFEDLDFLFETIWKLPENFRVLREFESCDEAKKEFMKTLSIIRGEFQSGFFYKSIGEVGKNSGLERYGVSLKGFVDSSYNSGRIEKIKKDGRVYVFGSVFDDLYST